MCRGDLCPYCESVWCCCECDTTETCEICNAREAYGTYNVEDVETWVCEHCAVNAIVVDGRIIFNG